MQTTDTNTTKPLNIAHKKEKPTSPQKIPPSLTFTRPPDVQLLDFGFPAPPSTIPDISSVKNYRRRGREIDPEELNTLVLSIEGGEASEGDNPCLAPRQTPIASIPETKTEGNVAFSSMNPHIDASSSTSRITSNHDDAKFEASKPKHPPGGDSGASKELLPVSNPADRSSPHAKDCDDNKALPQAAGAVGGTVRFASSGVERAPSESTGKSNYPLITIVPREQLKGVQFEELPRPSASSSKTKQDGHWPTHHQVKKDTSDAVSISSKMSMMSAREKFQAGGRSVARSIKASIASLRSAALSPRTSSVVDDVTSTTDSPTRYKQRQRSDSQPLPPQFTALPPFTRLDGAFDREAQFAYGRPKPLSLNLHLPKIPYGFRKEKAKKPEIIHLEYDEMTHAVVTLNPYRIEFILPKSMREQMEQQARNPPPESLVKTMKREFREVRRDVNRLLRPRESPLPPELGGQDGGISFAMKMATCEPKLQAEADAASVQVQTFPSDRVIDITHSNNDEQYDGDDRSMIRRKRAQYFRRTTSFPNLRTHGSTVSTTSSQRGLRQARGWNGVPMPPAPLRIDPENCTAADVIESAIGAYLEQAESLDQPLVLPLIRPLVIPGKTAPKLSAQSPAGKRGKPENKSTALVVSKEDLADAADTARKRQSIRGSVFFDLDIGFDGFGQERDMTFVDVGTREEADKYVKYRSRFVRPIDELNDDELEWIFEQERR